VNPNGNWFLDGDFEAAIYTSVGDVIQVGQQYPPGSLNRPPTEVELRARLVDCLRGIDADPPHWTWVSAPHLLREAL
jgi:hypothetical protein